jgi:CRISPR-associated endonuclease/helicase Cas3
MSDDQGATAMNSFLAHIRNEKGRLIAHALDEHLGEVSRLAAEFAAEFQAADWAALAGLWHDLGKYRPGFQRYIRQCGDPDAHIEGKVSGPEKTHSAAGALWAQRYLTEVGQRSGPVIARVLAYLIAGHHAGLDNWFGGLKERFAKDDSARELTDTLATELPESILHPPLPVPKIAIIPADHMAGIPGRFALWVRMLFSCLVDADFLDTEAFMSPDRVEVRAGFMPLDEMEALLRARLTAMTAQVAARGETDSPVNRKRAEVLQACIDKAELPPGAFSLTVPTGGGKTLSSLAFALRHAVRHGKKRVVYAIPYTSIIEQTAEIFRGIFGVANVIEHHCNVESDPSGETTRSRLACENWDAPLVVTTNVQLLESLFARKTSRCRKLHNLCNSVVILDEAQLLPVPYLQPVIDVLRLLVKDYGVTLVLCTATQPALDSRISFDMARQLRGFLPEEIVEIVDDVASLYAALERVRVHLPADLKAPQAWVDLGDEVSAHNAVLTVVSRRADARELYARIKEQSPAGLWHLSGLMCAQHRSDTIAAIKEALLARQGALTAGHHPTPVRVVSTQLVEAGVDIDFPVVFRALAGLDSIAQAAGRCNREGRLARGDVYVFVPPKPAPPGLLRQAEQTTRALWSALAQGAPPLAVERFPEYFRSLYGDAFLDEKGIVELLRVGREGDVNFRTAAESFRLIDNQESATVFVHYVRQGQEAGIDILLKKLQKEGPDRWLLRKLQRYGVTIYQHDLQRLLAGGDVVSLGADCPGLYVQASDLLYDPVLGVNVDGAPGDPASLVI